MIYSLSKQKIIIAIFSCFLFSQNCTILNSENYGDCNTILGYSWTSFGCLPIYGCDMGNDSEFFFTTCPTICPIMNVQMTKLSEEVREMNAENIVQFLSFSIDPKKDTPEALKKYKNLHCSDCSNWDFLTGNEELTHKLGIESFKVFAGREEEAEGGYAHSGAFSMVDQDGYLRGVYNITDFDGSVNKIEYQRLLKDLKILIES